MIVNCKTWIFNEICLLFIIHFHMSAVCIVIQALAFCQESPRRIGWKLPHWSRRVFEAWLSNRPRRVSNPLLRPHGQRPTWFQVGDLWVIWVTECSLISVETATRNLSNSFSPKWSWYSNRFFTSKRKLPGLLCKTLMMLDECTCQIDVHPSEFAHSAIPQSL